MATDSYIRARGHSKEFQIENYPSLYRKFLFEEVLDLHECYLDALHNILLSGKREGGRMLDFGYGPTTTKTASASRYYDEIIVADYSFHNRKEIRKWLKEEEGCLDWKPLYEVVAKLEGYSDIDGGTKEIEKRVRSSVKEVIHCDVLADPPIPQEYGKFDLLTTSFCTELVCVNPEMFKYCIKKLSCLIRDGGTLIMGVAVEGTSFEFYGKRLHLFPVTEVLIKESLDSCGLVINTWHFFKNKNDYSDYTGAVLFSAEKRK